MSFKRFLTIVFSIKTNACLSLTAMVICGAVVELIWGIPLITPWRVIQYAALSAIVALLQYICFDPRCIKKLSYAARGAIFLPCLLAVLIGFAAVFQWFPMGEWTAWVIFIAIFFAIFLGLLLGFEIMFRVTGRRYTALLDEKQNQG